MVRRASSARAAQRLTEPSLRWLPVPGLRPAAPTDRLYELLCLAVHGSVGGSAHLFGAGRTHSVFLNAAGAVLTCGSSYGDQDDEDEDELQEGAAMLGHGRRTAMETPNAVVAADFDGEPAPATRFVAVAAGAQCTLAISEAGEVFSCGASLHGQLGRSATHDDEHSLRCVGALQRRLVAADPIVAVACGLHHCLALSACGVVRSWGTGYEGALGHGKQGGPPERAPAVIEGLRAVRIVAIAAGSHHSLALSVTGVAFSWGLADCLGFAERPLHNLHSPHPIEALLQIASHDGARLCAIAAGGMHSMALAHTGVAYTWGTKCAARGIRPNRPRRRRPPRHLCNDCSPLSAPSLASPSLCLALSSSSSPPLPVQWRRLAPPPTHTHTSAFTLLPTPLRALRHPSALNPRTSPRALLSSHHVCKPRRTSLQTKCSTHRPLAPHPLPHTRTSPAMSLAM